MDGPEPMDWEASDLGPTHCAICNQDCFDPDLLLPEHISDSSLLLSSNILPVLTSCGHLFHYDCFQKCLPPLSVFPPAEKSSSSSLHLFHQNNSCPIDGCSILTVAHPENKSSFTFTSIRLWGFPCFPLTMDDLILQFTLSHYLKMSGPAAPKILSVDIVNNPGLQHKFEKLARRGLGNGDSLLLYHGTPYANVESICRSNFSLDRPVANGRAHGDGVYFTER